MTISSSLNAGVTGLNVNASKLATIADNIANSGTYGYKRADADFSSVSLTQSKGKYTAGGVNVKTFRDVAAQGALLTTSNPMDIAIGGARNVARYNNISSCDSWSTLSIHDDLYWLVYA